MIQRKRLAAALLSLTMAFAAVYPAVPSFAAAWERNANGSYVAADGSALTGITARGIDVSHWKQSINWNAVAADDVQFVMLGTKYNNEVDPYFSVNAVNAFNAGLKVGAYIYSYATTTAAAEAEADFVLNLIKDYPISYPVVLDVESTEMSALTPAQLADVINAFCKKVEAAGYYPMVYTNDYWLSQKIDMTKVPYDVWVARYNAKPAYAGAAMWQATNEGQIDGVNGNVDINFVFKDLSAKLPADRWRLIDGKWYYYKNYVKQTGWINDGQSWYYMNSDGTQYKGWLLLDNSYYYLLPKTGQMMTGWQTIDNVTYFFNPDGDMASGWTVIDNYWYYFNGNGQMMTGWLQLDGRYYYLHTDGRMVTGWQSDGTHKYYMDKTSGKMAVGWKQIDGAWYYFNPSGHMVTGWVKDNGKYYYMNPSDGKMISNGSYAINNINYTFDNSGVCLNEASAIDGGSAGSVYSPPSGNSGNSGITGNQVTNGTSSPGGMSAGNTGTGAPGGSAPGTNSAPGGNGITTVNPGSTPGPGGSSGNSGSTAGPGGSNGMSAGNSSIPSPGGSNVPSANPGASSGPGGSSGSSSITVPGGTSCDSPSCGSGSSGSSDSDGLKEFQTGGPK